VKALVVTNPEGARRVRERDLPSSVVIEVVEKGGAIRVQAILSAGGRFLPGEIFLVVGGPQLMISSPRNAWMSFFNACAAGPGRTGPTNVPDSSRERVSAGSVPCGKRLPE
jgi:hypothetical protein